MSVPDKFIIKMRIKCVSHRHNYASHICKHNFSFISSDSPSTPNPHYMIELSVE